MSTDFYTLDARRFLVDSWKMNAGYSSTVLLTEKAEDLDSLKKSEWPERFEKLVRSRLVNIQNTARIDAFFQYMKNRLIMGRFRYGKLNDPDKPKWNRVDRIRLEVKLFNNDDNAERLFDAANMCLLEYEEGTYDKEELIAWACNFVNYFCKNDDLRLVSSDDSVHNQEIRK